MIEAWVVLNLAGICYDTVKNTSLTVWQRLANHIAELTSSSDLQVANDGTNNSLKLWGEESFFGALADGEGA